MTETTRKRLPLRWLTVGEWVGVGALLLAGLGYWDTHRERAATEREHQAELRAGALKMSFLMTGTPDHDGGQVRLASVHPEQVIQTQTVWFPRAIRGDSVETTGDPRLEAGWIEEGLRKAPAKHGRVPVGVQTVFIEDGQTKTDRALYQLGYSLHPRVLRADKVELEGLSLSRRGVAGDLQGAADKAWGVK